MPPPTIRRMLLPRTGNPRLLDGVYSKSRIARVVHP
jgi:hypothetical protein